MKILIFPVSLVFSIIILIWAVMPTYKDAQKIKNTELPKLQEELNMELEISKNLVNLEQEYGMYEEDLKILGYAFPKESDLKSLLTQIETMILDSSLTYRNISIKGGDDSQSSTTNKQLTASGVKTQAVLMPQPEPIQIDLEISGSYENLRQFIDKVENLDRLANIISLSIKAETQKKTEESGSNVLLKTDVTIEVYKQDPVDAVGIKRVLSSSATGSTNSSANVSQGVDATVNELEK